MLKAYLILAAAAVVILLLAYPIFSFTSSTSNTFRIENDTAYLNWTNGYVFNVTINSTPSNTSNDVIIVANGTSPLTANYSQTNSISSCLAGNYLLYVQNASTGSWTNTTDILNVTNITIMNLVDMNAYNASGQGQSCAPGRYYTNQSLFKNSTNSSDNANITVIVDIPISTNNTLSPTTYIGSFSGSLPANATTYQSYYFNTSAIPNATAVTLNISGWNSSQNADFWLMNGSTMLAKSINQNTSEYLNYNFITYNPNAQMFEARVYGNLTNPIPYYGNIIYSTLNVTNGSNTAQQFSSLDFGVLNVSGTNYFNVTLKNEGNVTLSNIAMSNNTYRVVRFFGSGTKNFTFPVADSTVDSSIHVSLNWTGPSNYTLKLYNPSAALATISSNYYKNANVSSVDQELFNDTSASQGYWTVVVSNNTVTNDQYNVTLFIYQAPNWITTNYTARSFSPFTSNLTTINITVPNKTVDGNYEGRIFFTDANNARIILPYNVTVTAPTLVVTNGSYAANIFNIFDSDTRPVYEIDENYNATITRSLNLNLSDIGYYNLSVVVSNSSNLVCSSCSGFNATNFTLNTTGDIYIGNHSYQVINFNVSFNTSYPQGTYDGWIFINATNSTNSLSSHPYSTYNLTVRLVLSSTLSVQIANLISGSVGNNIANVNSSLGDNVTAKINVTYLNGTVFSKLSANLVGNFTQMWLQEGNVTTILGEVPQSGNLTFANGTYPFQDATNDLFNLNFTVPANTPGGLYTLYTLADFLRTDSLHYTGQGISATPVIVNNTGLFMSSNTSGVCSFGSTCSKSISMNPNGTLNVYAQIDNYSPVTAGAATLNITTSCTGYTISSVNTTGNCTQTSFSGTNWVGTVFPYTTNNCTITWTLTAGTSSAGAPNCATAYLMGGGGTWFDPNGVNLTITVNNVTSPGAGTSSSNNVNLPSSTTPVYVSITNYTSIIYITQGSANSTTVNVKNVNDSKTQDIGLAITNLTSSWYSISPTVQSTILPYSSTNFSISFTIPTTADVADYNAKLVASNTYGNDSKSFVVRVLPSSSTKVSINSTYQLYLLNYTDLAAEVNRSKTSGLNTSVVDADLALVKSALDQVKTYIESGDYFTAAQYLMQAKNFLNQAHTDYGNLTASPITSLLSFLGPLQHYWFYFAIAGGVAATAVIAYLFWPTGEGAKGVLFKPSIGTKSPDEGIWNKLKVALVKLKNKLKRST